MKEHGFTVSPEYQVCKNADEVWEAISKIGKDRLEITIRD